MKKKTLSRACSVILAAILLTAAAGCAEQKTGGFDIPVFTSYRDIPGVNAADIAAIGELQSRVESFNYAVNYSTEAFHGEDGIVKGFADLFCQWLSELFEIPFIPQIAEWDELVEGLENGTIDFTGELTANEDRRKKYFMTDDIVQRQIIYIRLDNNIPLNELAQTRTLNYAFLDGATTVDDVRRQGSSDFNAFFVDDYDHAYDLLVSGEIDAFFDEAPGEAAFDFFGEVYVNVFFPIIYSPVSLSTQNPDNKPIIDVVQKALDNGAIHHLTMLNNQGHQEYLKHKLYMLLTEEEREYIRNNRVVPYAAEITNYPVSFFDSRSKQWEGIAHDIVSEMERLTGLTFERQNDENSNWPDLLEMLKSGQAAMITELIPSDDRIGDFLWSGEEFFRDHFVLISKTEFHDITINEILYVSTGTARNTAHSTLFKSWFPNHKAIFEYENTNEALDALERGDIDMVITSEHQLLIMTNYRELVGYKANFIFDFYFDSTFGFNKNEAVLKSIVTKAMRLIDVNGISGRWLRRTYDYRIRVEQERVPYLIGVGMLSVGLIFAVVLFVRKRKQGMKLETLVDIRTKELSENQQQLIEAVEVAQEASRTKTAFLANMSHEIRTPMNAIIGMSEILEHERLDNRQMNYVKDISLSAHSLLGIINDILDMSKIEAGKLELNPVDYSFESFADNIVSMFTHVAGQKDIDFLYEKNGKIPDCLFGDDLRLKQALTNICGNAVKFTETGYVKLSATMEANRLIFEIEDTGPGIRQEDLPGLFNAFEQVDKTKNRGVVGTGLGLSICKAFVEMMDGEIYVESIYGHGTKFTIVIPAVEGDITKIRAAEPGSMEYTLSAPDAKVLVTDDNEFNLKVASGLLGFMDIDAETADSGSRAIELVMQNDYDIIFMDHMMPEMDGVETVLRIRGLGGKYEDLIIIALTANAVTGAREMFLSNGFNDFLSKPIDASELQETVRRYLPHQKVSEAAGGNGQAVSDREAELHRKSIITFVKENRNTYDMITVSLSSGDIKTAHRIAHTLKSSAGYLGLGMLQTAAFSLEQSLGDENHGYTTEQLEFLKDELEKALGEYESVFLEAQSARPDAVQVSAEELELLFRELRPLLEKGDLKAANYLEKLYGIEGMEELASRIDDYDFEGALQILGSLS